MVSASDGKRCLTPVDLQSLFWTWDTIDIGISGLTNTRPHSHPPTHLHTHVRAHSQRVQWEGSVVEYLRVGYVLESEDVRNLLSG
jgi:hypothetical protein